MATNIFKKSNMATTAEDLFPNDVQKSEDDTPPFDSQACKIFFLERWKAVEEEEKKRAEEAAIVKKDCEDAIARIARAAKRMSGRRTKKWLMLLTMSLTASKAASKTATKTAFKKSTVARLQWERMYVQVRLSQEKIIPNKWFGVFMQITRFLRFKAAVEDVFGSESGAPKVTMSLGQGGAVQFVYTTCVSAAFGVKKHLDEKKSLKEAMEAVKSGAMRKTYVELHSRHVF